MCQSARQDDPTITADEWLLRRVHPKQLVKDDDTGKARVSTSVFRDKELSINIESVLRSNNEMAADCLRNYSHHLLVCFTAGQARFYQQIVCRDPLPLNLSHGLVCGSKSSRRVLEGLRASAVWVLPTQAPEYTDIPAE